MSTAECSLSSGEEQAQSLTVVKLDQKQALPPTIVELFGAFKHLMGAYKTRVAVDWLVEICKHGGMIQKGMQSYLFRIYLKEGPRWKGEQRICFLSKMRLRVSRPQARISTCTHRSHTRPRATANSLSSGNSDDSGDSDQGDPPAGLSPSVIPFNNYQSHSPTSPWCNCPGCCCMDRRWAA